MHVCRKLAVPPVCITKKLVKCAHVSMREREVCFVRVRIHQRGQQAFLFSGPSVPALGGRPVMFRISSCSLPPVPAELSPYELHRKPHEMVTDSTVVAVSPRALRSELMCPICLDLMKNPLTTKEVDFPQYSCISN